MRSIIHWFTSFNKLKSDDIEIAREGINEVAQFGNLSIPRLRQLLEQVRPTVNTPTVKRNALLALGKIGNPKTDYLISRYLNHGSETVQVAAREALSSIAHTPYAARMIKAYDAWQASNQFVEKWYSNDPAANVFYIQRFLPVDEETLLVSSMLLATVPVLAAPWSWCNGFVAGIPVTMSAAGPEYSEVKIPPMLDNSLTKEQRFIVGIAKNSARFVLKFTNTTDRDRVLESLPTLFTPKQDSVHHTVNCTGEIMLPSWADYPDVMAFQSFQNGASYFIMAQWGFDMTVSDPDDLPVRDPEKAIEGNYRETARAVSPRTGDLMVFNGINNRNEDVFGIVTIGSQIALNHYNLTILTTDNSNINFMPGDILYRKIFWQEVPVSVDNPEPFHAHKTAPLIKIVQCHS